MLNSEERGPLHTHIVFEVRRRVLWATDRKLFRGISATRIDDRNGFCSTHTSHGARAHAQLAPLRRALHTPSPPALPTRSLHSPSPPALSIRSPHLLALSTRALCLALSSRPLHPLSPLALLTCPLHSLSPFAHSTRALASLSQPAPLRRFLHPPTPLALSTRFLSIRALASLTLRAPSLVSFSPPASLLRPEAYSVAHIVDPPVRLARGAIE